MLVRITRAGRAALRSAAVVHIAGIEREFTTQLSDEEAEVARQGFPRLLRQPRASSAGMTALRLSAD